MFSALIQKEWRQLRPLRWAGVGLGALIPLAFLAGAEAAHRGWAPLGTVSSYTFHNILLELVPWTFALGLWPLAALLTTAQTFFLLEAYLTRRLEGKTARVFEFYGPCRSRKSCRLVGLRVHRDRLRVEDPGRAASHAGSCGPSRIGRCVLWRSRSRLSSRGSPRLGSPRVGNGRHPGGSRQLPRGCLPSCPLSRRLARARGTMGALPRVPLPVVHRSLPGRTIR